MSPYDATRVLLLPLACALALACGEAPVAPTGPTVTIEKPERRPVTDYLEVTGTVASAEDVDIRARVEGFLESIHFEEGDYVEKDALLYVIDPREYEARLESAKAALEMAGRVVGAELDEVDALAGRDVAITSFSPGVLDTAMQEQIRGCGAEAFPQVERFRALPGDGALIDPARPAAQIVAWVERDGLPRVDDRSYQP